MFKHILSTTILLLLASGAQASTTYVLNNIVYDNTFGTNPVVCDGCGTGTAVDDGSGNITLTGIAWSFISAQSVYSVNFSGTTTLAPTRTPVTNPVNSLPPGSDITVTSIACSETVGTSCDPLNLRSGWNQPVFYTGLHSGGATCGQPATNFASINRCRVDLSVSGSDLTMSIKRALSESTTSGSYQQMTYSFSVVPVPAAVWLFGSSVGLLGLARRKRAA